jgi:hypothetical protein
MKYLCLIYLDEQQLAALPAAEVSALNARHWDVNDRMRTTGNFIVAEALEPAHETACVRVRQGKVAVTDGPFIESKEMVAGFYLLEADTLEAAAALAAQIPSAALGTIEVRPARQLIVDGRESRWG